MNKLSDEELVSQGLMGESYDSIRQVRTRVRQIGDIAVPLRGGLAPAQFGVGLLVMFASILVFALIIRPAFALFGVQPHWLITATVILGPPILAAQRIIKPMRHGKSISSAAVSWWRYITDEPVHARGLPTPKREQDSIEGATLVYQRTWVPEEGLFGPDTTDARSERLLDGYIPDLEGWVKERAIAHRIEHDKRREEDRHQTARATTTRSRGKSVIIDKEMAA